MSLPIRKTFAALLWVTAATPVAMVATHVSDPELVFRAAERGGYLLTQAAWLGAGFFLVTLLFYPPFLPFLRLRFGEIRRRLGTDRGPMHDTISQLRNFETHIGRFNLGKMARELGDFGVAFENLKRAHEMEPQHTATMYQLGLLLEETGNHANAVTFLGAVVTIDETHGFGDALFHLGRCLFRLHRDGEALACLGQHQNHFPGHRQTHLLVARVLADVGRLDEAREQLAQAARPIPEGKKLKLAENLARTRAKVTILRKGKGEAK